MDIRMECRGKCRQDYQQCMLGKRGRGADPDERRVCEDKLKRCQDACEEQPKDHVAEELILICAQNTCQMRKKSILDMNDPDVQKRIASCSGKAVGAECKPFIKEDRLACYQGRCVPYTQIPDWETGKYSYTACDGKARGDACGREPCGPDNPCPEGQKCVDGKCEVTKIYCCKKCEDKKVKKIQSASPCVPPYVRCDQKLECNGNGNGDGENPCPEGGYRNPTVDGRVLAPCDSGYFEKTNAAGEHWCCMETEIELPECEGGHKLPHGGSSCEEGFKLKVIDGVNWCCPEDGNGGEACSGGYKKPEGEPCMSGFHTEAFEEVPWCCPDKEEEEGEEFKWSPELQALLDRLGIRAEDLLGYKSPDVLGKLEPLTSRIKDRINYLLDYPRGMTDAERQTLINYYTKGIQRGERGELQSSVDRLARMGLLGSGFELREAGRIGRETKESEAEMRSRLAIDEMDRRFEELMGTTAMAGQLTEIPIGLEKWDAERVFKEMMGTTGMGADIVSRLMGAEQIPEVLSGARRAEGQASMDSLLRYFASMMGGQASAFGPYLQAIMAQGQEGSSANWLPWIGYLLGSKIKA